VKLDKARELFDAAVRRAEEIGAPSSIAVVDAGGHVVIKGRMEGAPLVTVRMCEDKAYTAASVEEPTADLLPEVQPGKELFGLFAAEAGRFIVFGGGVPLFDDDGALEGGLGVAGGTVDQDLAIADAALAAWSPA
jgi:uncharacterized protein GlcG (DUF336 family)